MKLKLLLLLYLTFYSFGSLISQVKFVKDIIIANNKVNEEIHYYPEVKNEGSSQAEFYWKLTKPAFNPGWASQVCDLNGICYAWNVDKSSKVNKLPGNGTNQMSFQLNPNSIADSGVVLLSIYTDAAYTNLLDTLSIFLNISQVTSSRLQNIDREISIYPNPASSYFQLSNNQNVGRVEIFNMIGKKIKTFEKSQSSYNIRDLRNGVYLLRLYDSKGQVIKVVRLKIDHENP
ncbi:MAG: T9SS type A sorting domain-containing protein [Deltaproteobacteria bacterium]